MPRGCTTYRPDCPRHHAAAPDPSTVKGRSRRDRPFTLSVVGYFFLPRFSRTRTEMWIGVPSKPNSSRSRRSMKRR